MTLAPFHGLHALKTKIENKTFIKAGIGALALVCGGAATLLSYKNKLVFQDKIKKLEPTIEILLTIKEKERLSGLAKEEKILKKTLLQEIKEILQGTSVTTENPKEIRQELEQKETRWLWYTIGSCLVTGIGTLLLGWGCHELLYPEKGDDATNTTKKPEPRQPKPKPKVPLNINTPDNPSKIPLLQPDPYGINLHGHPVATPPEVPISDYVPIIIERD